MLAMQLNSWSSATGPDDCAIKDILYKPFAYNKHRKDEIMQYLDDLDVRDCYVIHRDQAYMNEEGLKTEPIYGTQYKIEPFDMHKLFVWSCTYPRPTEKIGQPPKNTFLPTKPLESMRVKVPKVEKPGKPEFILGTNIDESNVWFKRDDTFDQPYVWAKIALLSKDHGFPKNKAISAFIEMWIKMLDEDIRELSYVAHLSGIQFGSTWNEENIGFDLYSFN